jgi:hypothetical protein
MDIDCVLMSSDGIVANDLLSFGPEVFIAELYNCLSVLHIAMRPLDGKETCIGA